jgi:hypothetical protein
MVRKLWQNSPELMATAGLMLIVLAGALVGLVVDPTIITGVPAWLKPAKFAVSIAIYSVTLAWIFILIPEWTRTRRVIGWITAITMVIEMAIIGSQAWRGTTSHFNVATPYDAVLFGIMGASIVFQTLSSIAVAVALWRHRFADRSLGWALRFGMAITIIGALTGGLMTRPTASQIAARHAGMQVTVNGSHTIGAPDGGAGLPGTGWSRAHGDVRVAHFVGLHAMQALPLFALFLSRRRLALAQTTRARLVLTGVASYASLYVILLIEALRGVSIAAPDAISSMQFAVWATATAIAAVITLLRAPGAERRRGARAYRHHDLMEIL